MKLFFSTGIQRIFVGVENIQPVIDTLYKLAQSKNSRAKPYITDWEEVRGQRLEVNKPFHTKSKGHDQVLCLLSPTTTVECYFVSKVSDLCHMTSENWKHSCCYFGHHMTTLFAPYVLRHSLTHSCSWVGDWITLQNLQVRRLLKSKNISMMSSVMVAWTQNRSRWLHGYECLLFVKFLLNIGPNHELRKKPHFCVITSECNYSSTYTLPHNTTDRQVHGAQVIATQVFLSTHCTLLSCKW